jgi:hypothetical protein
MGALDKLGNIVGIIVGAAIVAVLAAKPKIVSDFFGGIATATKAAVSPVTKG